MKQEITTWRDWHDFWIKSATERKIPVYFFRFEDLTADPGPILTDVFKFALAQDNLAGTLLEKRIALLCQQKSEGK